MYMYINLASYPGSSPEKRGNREEPRYEAMQMLCLDSLVPWPFPPPVFDHLLYTKMEGEGLGERIMCMTSGRHEGGSARSL